MHYTEKNRDKMDSNETEKWKNKKNQGNGIVSLKKINKIGRP